MYYAKLWHDAPTMLSRMGSFDRFAFLFVYFDVEFALHRCQIRIVFGHYNIMKELLSFS